MRLRTLALALALLCASSLAVEARPKVAPHRARRVAVKRPQIKRAGRASMVRPRKAKRVKSHPRKTN